MLEVAAASKCDPWESKRYHRWFLSVNSQSELRKVSLGMVRELVLGPEAHPTASEQRGNLMRTEAPKHNQQPQHERSQIENLQTLFLDQNQVHQQWHNAVGATDCQKRDSKGALRSSPYFGVDKWHRNVQAGPYLQSKSTC